MGFLTAIAVVVLVPELVSATDSSSQMSFLRPAYLDCVGGGGTTTAAVLQCAHDEFVFQDKRLNENYRALMSSLPATEKAALRDEERKWLVFKAKRCALPDEAGTADQVASADCEVTETEKQATKLQHRIHK
ncbi:Protein of unknown function [Dyella sp. 333MFSha]|nr:Protein of unknown function [Dyella sp. 333MFSha]